MIRTLSLLLSAVLGAAGGGCAPLYECGGQYTYESTDWTPEQTLVLHASAQAWNEIAGRTAVTLNPGPGEMCHIAPVDSLGEDVGGEMRVATGNISVIRKRVTRPDALQIILMHELGHGLGLDHVGSRGALMYAEVNELSAFGAADLAECQAVGVCAQN